MANYNARTLIEAKNLRIIDDALFRLIGTRKAVCQEILRTLLDDDKLIVKSVTTQKAEVSINRGIVLDALCILKDDSLCNIEMQKVDSSNDIKRVRFHASLITANHTPKNTEFDKIPNVKILYITEYDALGNGQAVTHISRCQLHKKTYKPINDGEDIIFANAKCRKRNEHTRLLKLFLKKESFYDELYPALSEAIKHYKDTEKGRDEVCKSIEDYATDIAKEQSIDAIINTCIAHKDSLEQTVEFVKKQYAEATIEHITSRFKLLNS